MTKTVSHAKQADREVWRVGVLFSRSGLMAITESEHFFGTALAIYTLWALLNDDARREFGRPPRTPAP